MACGSRQAEILIGNFGNAASVQTENAPSRTLQNYQQLYLVRNRSRLKSSGPQERRRRVNCTKEKKRKQKRGSAEMIPQLLNAAEIKEEGNRGGAELDHESDKAAYFCCTVRKFGALMFASLFKMRRRGRLYCTTFSKVPFIAAAT